MIVGLAFNRMLQGWPKLARLLMALFVVAGGIPFGLIWGLLELGLDPIQLANETGVGVWNLEWAMANVGLFGGMWPRWTIPAARLFGGLAGWILSGPLAAIRWIGQKALDWLGWTGGFFQSTGRAILWAPTQIYRLMTRTLHNIGAIREQWLLPPDTVTSRHTRHPSQRRARTPTPKPTPAAANSNGSHNDAPRVTGVVEDRCPYCLDIVKRNDPRGVRICQVCGAPHHRDCWAITGKCQIPHPNT